ncbi:MAG TPA: Plug domain-containing protein [Longimicrobiaceae bacterium]|nr:Plug domain-containing protein [Longimicrobiaceae bacterium]
MSRRMILVSGVASTVALGACLASAPSPEVDGSGSPAPSTVRTGSATVIPGADLQTRGGSLLDALSGRVSNIQVARRSNGGCPLVTLRGRKSFVTSSDALVYVDGVPMLDTCILNQIRTVDVERVEVYPGGSSAQAGYRSSPNGLILVFLTGS